MSEETIWEKEKLSALLEASKSAISRSRYIFGAINIATILMLSAQFNFLTPWVRNAINRAPTEKIREALQEYQLIDLRSISVPVIGIKFSVADLSVVGAVGMALLAVWLFYSVRRENHVLSNVAREANQAIAAADIAKAAYLYHGVAHQFVFSTITTNDRSRVGGTFLVKTLLYAPCWALLFVVACDIVTVAISSTVQFNTHVPLADTLSPAEIAEVVARSAFCLVVAFFCFVQCRDCERLEYDSLAKLERVRRHVETDDVSAQVIGLYPA